MKFRGIRYLFVCFVFAFVLREVCGFAYEIKPCPRVSTSVSQPVLNLVFCPLNYQDKEFFLEDIDTIIAKLGRTRPFDEFVGEIGFYYVSLSRKEENTILKRTQGFPPLEVRRDFLDGISAYLKSNYKLIIIDALSFSSCAELSSIDKTSLIILGKARYKNKHSFAKGFLHELGHSLGLRDECVNCERLCPPGSPNCAPTKEEAKRWWGDLVGEEPKVNYIAGCCGNKDYIRPTIASLMNDSNKAEDFGPVNERYLRKELER